MAQQEQLIQRHALEQENDFTIYNEGDDFPRLRKPIHILVMKEKDFIVFLDQELNVHWYYGEEYPDFADDYGEIVSKEADLETASGLLLAGEHLKAVRHLLAAGIARLLDESASTNAAVLLRKAEAYIQVRSRERAKLWYLPATVISGSTIVLMALVLWAFRSYFVNRLGFSESIFEGLLGCGAGAFGAALSVLLRSNTLELDASAGPRVHVFEGIQRTLFGAGGGLLMTLAIKSNFILGFVNKVERPLLALLLVCLIAGVSERFVPSVIKKIEGFLTGHDAGIDEQKINRRSRRARSEAH